MLFKNHVPSSCSGVDRFQYEFTDLDDLLKQDFITKWKMEDINPDYLEKTGNVFINFTFSDYADNCKLLVANYSGTKWVIGYVYDMA